MLSYEAQVHPSLCSTTCTDGFIIYSLDNKMAPRVQSSTAKHRNIQKKTSASRAAQFLGENYASSRPALMATWPEFNYLTNLTQLCQGPWG